MHYGTDKAGGNRKTVIGITGDEPGLMSMSGKKASAKKSTATKKVLNCLRVDPRQEKRLAVCCEERKSHQGC